MSVSVSVSVCVSVCVCLCVVLCVSVVVCGFVCVSEHRNMGECAFDACFLLHGTSIH